MIIYKNITYINTSGHNTAIQLPQRAFQVFHALQKAGTAGITTEGGICKKALARHIFKLRHKWKMDVITRHGKANGNMKSRYILLTVASVTD